MPTVLHLGEIEVPYAHDKESTTTGDVAEYLEHKYHVMEIFFELHGAEVRTAVVDGYGGLLESLLSGAPPQDLETVLNAGMPDVERLFKTFIDSGEIEGLGYPGVPTKASIDRKSGRFKKGKSKRPRPSFVDTTLYVDSFKSWVEYDAFGFAAYGATMAAAMGEL